MYSQDTHYSSRLARSEIRLVYWMLKRMHSLDSGTFASVVWQEGGGCVLQRSSCLHLLNAGESHSWRCSCVHFCGREAFTSTDSDAGAAQRDGTVCCVFMWACPNGTPGWAACWRFGLALGQGLWGMNCCDSSFVYVHRARTVTAVWGVALVLCRLAHRRASWLCCVQERVKRVWLFPVSQTCHLSSWGATCAQLLWGTITLSGFTGWPRHSAMAHLHRGVRTCCVEGGAPKCQPCWLVGSGSVTSCTSAQRCLPPWPLGTLRYSLVSPFPSCPLITEGHGACSSSWWFAVPPATASWPSSHRHRQRARTALSWVCTAVWLAEREESTAELNLLALFGGGGAGAASRMQTSHRICLVMVSHAQQSSCMV